MSRYKNGNPKRQSRFICLHCMNENMIATGIQRVSQREKNHVKDMYCLHCKKVTKNIEVRHCDTYAEVFANAKTKREKYYID